MGDRRRRPRTALPGDKAAPAAFPDPAPLWHAGDDSGGAPELGRLYRRLVDA